MSRSHSKLGNPNMFEDISDSFLADLKRVFVSYEAIIGRVDSIQLTDLEPSSAAIIWLRQNYLTKMDDKRTGKSASERRRAAVVKWLGVEERNARTNKRIFSTSPEITIYSPGQYQGSVGASTYAWDLMFRARAIVRRVLGALADPVAPFLMEGGFTNGAGTSKRRAADTIARKYTERLDATPAAANLFALIEDDQFAGWWSHVPRFDPRLVKGNVLFTVPKNAEIDRVACKEPEINLWCQKAVGNHIRDRLRKFTPINLNDQTINQDLARRAYKERLATIDLSSASDSLTTSLCRAILPDDWYRLVMALRSPKTFIDGLSHTNEMIGSMGNGFTFELESLIFYALAQACVEAVRELNPSVTSSIGIFGDDIIVARDVARPLVSLLGWAGFKVNASKTFTRGFFYESCGKHYYAGADVSPFYIRKPFRDVSDLIHALNQLRGWMIRTGVDLKEHSSGKTDGFYSLWKRFTHRVPRSLWGGWDETLRTQLVTMHTPRCRLVPVVREERRVVDTYQLGMYLARLHWAKGQDVWSYDYPETCETSEFPQVETGSWKIRRFDDRSKFFGIATNPLYQEMG